jgi:hypothetical protein
MRNFEFLAPLVKPVATVFLTVAVCVAVLFAVKPWQTEARDEHGTSNLSANVLTAEPKPLAKTASEAPVPALAKSAPLARSETASPDLVTASVKKPEKSAIPPPPERLPATETDEEPDAEDSAEADGDEL